MVNPNSPVNNTIANINFRTPDTAGPQTQNAQFSNVMKTAGEYISKVDDAQQASDASIKDLLTGSNEDITSVVSAVAKADMSFKLLVGVRNKLVEAYKQTMNMSI